MFLLILGVLVTIISSIFSFYEKSTDNKKNDKSNKTNIWYFIVIMVGIIAASISGINSMIEKNKSDKEKRISDRTASVSQKQLQAKSDLIIDIQKKVYEETQRSKDSLIKAKESIIRLQNKINDNIIGGNGPCFIVFQNSSEKKSSTGLINESKLPILNIEIYVTDFDELLKCKNSKREDCIVFDESCYEKCSKLLVFETVAPGGSLVKDYILPEKDEGRLEMRFFYKFNSECLEQLYYKRQGNYIRCLIRLLKLKGNKYVFLKYINPDKVDWRINFDKIFNLPLKHRKLGSI